LSVFLSILFKPTEKFEKMNAGLNVAHKAVVGTLVFFSAWGAYSVAGGTGIVIKRRWDRKNAEHKEDENNEPLTPVIPKISLPDLDTVSIKRVD
jgi:hypothetical protein